MPEPRSVVEIKNGKVLSPRVADKVTSKIEKGQMSSVAGIVIHQTGGANAQSALASVELVAPYDARKSVYAGVTEAQNQSLAWLVSALQAALALPDDRVHTDPEVSYKQPSEASTAKWK